MGISFSNIGTVGREQLITSGGNGEQNWSYIPSKGKSTKKANNRTYQFADEKTKKQIAYMSGYYLHVLGYTRELMHQGTSAYDSEIINLYLPGDLRSVTDDNMVF